MTPRAVEGKAQADCPILRLRSIAVTATCHSRRLDDVYVSPSQNPRTLQDPESWDSAWVSPNVSSALDSYMAPHMAV